jgi:hypothetical protein
LLSILSIPIVQYARGSLSTAHTISSYGAIDYSSAHSGSLLFKMNFQDVVIIDGHQLGYANGTSLPLENQLNYADGTATCNIINDPTANSGKSLHALVYAGQGDGTRWELIFWPEDLPGITDEIYTVTRMRFPDGYHLAPPSDHPTWQGWHEIGNVWEEWAGDNPSPYMMHTQYGQTEDRTGYLFVLEGEEDDRAVTYFNRQVPTTLPTGWFTVKTYVKLHPTDGIVRIWINDVLMFDISGVKTYGGWPGGYCEVAKLYGGNILPSKELWVDSVEIHKGIP